MIRKKLGSQSGASITFALLLFLVCSVVSVIVLVAGTTTSGRMASQARSDQRYYAVASAVELLKQDFSQKTVTVSYSYTTANPDGPRNADPTAKAICNTITPTSSYNPSEFEILKAVSVNLTKLIAGGAVEDIEMTLSTGASPDALKCGIKGYVKKDGRVIFEVYNKPEEGDDDKRVFTLQVTFIATLSESRVEVGDTTTVTTHIAWRFGGIRKGAVL